MQRIKRIAITILGGSVLALGIAMLLLPGPAFLVIPAGLAILAIEFAWARRWQRSASALLPQPSKGDSAVTKKLTVKSLWRSAGLPASAGVPNSAAAKKEHMIQILLLITLAVGLLAQWHVKRTYTRHSRTPVQSGHTGTEAAHEILRQAGLTNVTIFSIEHERDAAAEEPEFQLKWKANGKDPARPTAQPNDGFRKAKA